MPEETAMEPPVHNPLWGRVLVVIMLAFAVITAAAAIIFLGKLPVDVNLWLSNSHAAPTESHTR